MFFLKILYFVLTILDLPLVVREARPGLKGPAVRKSMKEMFKTMKD